MIALYAAKAFGFLRSLPWQLWLVVAVLATGWFWGNHRYHEGVEDTQARYAAAAAKALQAAGAAYIYLAGRPGEKEAEFRAAGIGDFAFAGGNALAMLTAAYDRMA